MTTPRDAAASCRLRDYMDVLAEGSVYETDPAERERFAVSFIEEVAAYEEQGPDYLDHAVKEKRDRLVAWRDIYAVGEADKLSQIAAEYATLQGEENEDTRAAIQARIATLETWVNVYRGLKAEFAP